MEESSLSTNAASPAPADDAPHKRSRGERAFDTLVYGGIAGVGAFVATVPFAYYLKHGGGKIFHEKLSKAFESAANYVRPNTSNVAMAENVAMTTTLMQGGNATLIGVGLAEKYKVPIVEKLNQLLGDKTPAKRVEETPKQTWMSLIKARFTAWIVVFSSLMGASKIFPRSFETFETECGERFCQLLGKATHDAAGKETRSFFFGKIGALDMFATAAAATLLYIGGHFFAKRQEEKAAHRVPGNAHSGPLREDAPEEALTVATPADAAQPALQIEGAKTRLGPVLAPVDMAHAPAV